MKNLIKFYLAIFFRRLHYFLPVFLIIAIASITLARVLPPVYVSEANLLVEPPQISGDLIRPTIVTGPTEQLQIIEQRLLARPNLLDIAV